VIIPNGIPDPPLGTNPVRQWRVGVPSILYLGLVSRAKGVETLIDACRNLAAEDRPFKLVIAGPFESHEMEASLHAERESGLLGNRLEICGPVAGAEKWRLYSEADLLCFPSEHPSETFGLVIVEAFAAGIPVVATRRRGAPEIIEEGNSGLLFEPGDAEDLANQLRQLLDSSRLRESLGQNARERYLEEYTDRTFLKRIELAIESICPEVGE
jgi:glycosyltransferase involved in cell wall biosynthesis